MLQSMLSLFLNPSLYEKACPFMVKYFEFRKAAESTPGLFFVCFEFNCGASFVYCSSLRFFCFPTECATSVKPRFLRSGAL